MSALVQNEPLTGLLKHWQEFREYARTFRAGQAYDLERFWQGAPDLLVGLKDFAAILLSWITYSKRVFRLSKEMQSRFEVISLGNIKMSDIMLPFPSFGIELDSEMHYSEGDSFDFMVVSNFHELIFPHSKVEGNPVVAISTFSSTQSTYRAIPLEKKQSLLRKAKAGYTKIRQWNRDLLYLRKKIFEGGRSISQNENLLIPLHGDQLAEDYLAELLVGRVDRLNTEEVKRIRVIFNLCLYLQSLPAHREQEEGVMWKKESFEGDGFSTGSFVNSANLCDIVGRHILDSMMVDKDGQSVSPGSGWEAPPHWRRAHKRRPPGKGNDPEAERTVKVRHALVRADRILEFGGVVGSVSEVVQ